MIFDHGKFEMPDKALFIGNSLLLGNGAFGMNATDSASDYHAVIQRKFLKANPVTLLIFCFTNVKSVLY